MCTCTQDVFRCYTLLIPVTWVAIKPEPVLLLSTLNINPTVPDSSHNVFENPLTDKKHISDIPADDSEHSMPVTPQYSNGGKWDKKKKEDKYLHCIMKIDSKV